MSEVLRFPVSVIEVKEMEPLLTVRDAAAILRVHPVTLRNWARAGRVVGVKTGNHWKFEEAALALFIKQGRV